jgi:1-acylglycerol-3-phosphate O-acyltransferase
MLRGLLPPSLSPSPSARLVSLSTLLKEHPDSAIVVFPECTTSNGRGILKLSPSILTVPSKTKIFPINLRYTPADITTPVPGAYISFLWHLCSKPTHCIRVRIAEATYNTSRLSPSNGESNRSSRSTFALGTSTSDLDNHDLGVSQSSSESPVGDDENGGLNLQEVQVLGRVGDDLARLGRVKRVGLGVNDKIEFVKTWTKTRTIW